MAHALDASVVWQAAENGWSAILATICIPAEVLLNRKNQPCPACGGRDRFQFIDRGKGRFICRGIEGQGGDGFKLVMHLLNCDFKTALHAIPYSGASMQNSIPPMNGAESRFHRSSTALTLSKLETLLLVIWNTVA